MCYGYYDPPPPPLPRILIAFEVREDAEALAAHVNGNVTVAAPDYNTAAVTANTFDRIYLLGDFTDNAKVRGFYHSFVYPSGKKDATWVWP